MSFQLRQSATQVKLIALLQSNNQLRILNEGVDYVISSFEASGLRQDDPVVIVSAVGQPSAGKTGILNGVLNRLMTHLTAEMGPAQFPVPKNFQQDTYKYDGILVFPPLVIQWDDGTRRGVLILDVWNNANLSEDVYIKLVEFCFEVSSLRIFSLCNPLRTIPWWNAGSAFEASSLTELKQPCWKNVTMEWPHPNLIAMLQQQSSSSPEFHYNYSKCCQIPQLISIDATSGQTGLFQVSMIPADGNGQLALVSEKGFNFIVEQVINADNHSNRFSDLKTKLMNSFSNGAAKSSVHIPIAHVDPSSHDVNIETGLGNPLEGSSHVTVDHSDEQLMDTEMPCDSQNFQAATEDTEVLIENLRPEIDKYLEDYFSQTAIHEFSKASESDQFMMNDPQLNPDHAAINIAVTITRTLPSAQLPQNTERFTIELTKIVKARILQRLESLKEPMKPTCDVLTHALNTTTTEPHQYQSVVYPRNEPSLMETQVQEQPTSTQVVSALQRVKIPESVGIWRCNVEDPEFAKKASKIAIDSVQERLLKYLACHGILTDAEILAAFNFIIDAAKNASSSVPGFDLNKTVWQTAWKGSQSSEFECLAEIRLSNSNAIRRWDRALLSALEKANKSYNQLMDEYLPNYKIRPEQLDILHDDCIRKTVEKFNVPAEISRPTVDYCKKVLLKSKSEEWRLGYALENETKEVASQFHAASHLLPVPSQPPPPAHFLSLDAGTANPEAEPARLSVNCDVQSARDRLSQLLRSMEEMLKISGSEDDPVRKHVSKSVDEYKSLLQNPSASGTDLNSAIEKLEAQKDMLD